MNIKNKFNHISHINKLAIITFGDKLTTVKLILDHYGFKVSFFVTCYLVDDNTDKNVGKDSGNNNETPPMSWSEKLALKQAL